MRFDIWEVDRIHSTNPIPSTWVGWGSLSGYIVSGNQIK